MFYLFKLNEEALVTFWLRILGVVVDGFESRLSFLEMLEYTFHTLAYARAKNNKLITIAHHSACRFRSSDCIYAVFDGNYGIASFV
jgi:hypothetical protein